MNIDKMSISGHKLYRPKGIGDLCVRRKPKVSLHAQMNGWGQEKGMRSGTLAPSVSFQYQITIFKLVVGLGEAARLAKLEMWNDLNHVTRLSQKFLKAMR
jgi:cysteine desulfurase